MYPSPKTPILGTPAFQQGLKDPKFRAIRQRGISRFVHFSRNNHLMTKTEIEQDIASGLDFLRKMQLDAFIRTKLMYHMRKLDN